MYVGSNAPGTEKGYNSMHQASNVGSYLRPQTSSFPTDKEQNELLCGRGGSSVRSEIRRAGCCEFWCGGTYCGVVCCGVVPEKQRDPLLTIEPLVELTIEAELTGAHHCDQCHPQMPHPSLFSSSLHYRFTRSHIKWTISLVIILPSLFARSTGHIFNDGKLSSF